MSLSRKHYKAIADIMNRYSLLHPVEFTIDDCIADLATYFKQDNPRFDKQRFYDACYKIEQK